MILIWILFGLIITSNLITFGLYRKFKADIRNLLYELSVARARIIRLERKKEKMKEKAKRGRPRKQDTAG